MLTKIDICSMALLKIGESPIQSFTDSSASAQLASHLYDSAMNSLLSMHPWKFATKKFIINKTGDDDFLIPSDVLRIVQCDGEIMGNRIKARGDKTEIIAIVAVNADAYPAYFVSLAATKLAMEFCIPLSGDQNVFRMLGALYESELRAAKFIDSTMAASADIADFSLISARY